MTLQEPPSQERAEQYGLKAVFFVVSADREDLQHLAGMVDDGQLQVVISRSYPLSRGRQAYESGNTLDRSPGKTVLVVR